MRELSIMFVQGLLYIVLMLYLTFASVELYKDIKSKMVAVPESIQEEPTPANQQPLYILSPGKEA